MKQNRSNVSKFPTEEKLIANMTDDILDVLNKYADKESGTPSAIFVGVLELCKEAVMQEVRSDGGE